MSDWRETTLGEITDVIGGGTPSTKQKEFWGGDILWLTPGELTKRAGQVIDSTERQITDSGLASSSARLLAAGTVLLTSRATVGVVGIAGQLMATNQGFQSLTAGPDVLPLFLMYWSQRNRREFESRASGSTFPEISRREVRKIPILLPPIGMQRSIINLTSPLDCLIKAHEIELKRLGQLLERSATSLCLLPQPYGQVAVKSLLSRNIGGTWGLGIGEEEIDVDVYRSTEFSDWARLSGRADARRSVPTNHYAKRDLEAGDILIEKSGGTPTRSTGRVVEVDEHDLWGPSVGANFLQIVRVDPGMAHPRYVFWVLWATHRRGDGFDFQTASTNIRNLRTKDYLARRVDLPDSDSQVMIAETLDGLLAAIDASSEGLARLRVFRSTFLSALLSRSISISEAYDALLEVVPSQATPEGVVA